MTGEVTIHSEGGGVAHGQPVAADPMFAMIERAITSPDFDVSKLERLLELQERASAKAAEKEFAHALAAARAEIPPIIKDRTVDFGGGKGRTSYSYESLAGIAKVIDPILSKYGLTYRFRTSQANGAISATCIVSHAGGHSEETTLSGPPDQSGSKGAYQAIGSAVTYLQRYTLKAALGLSAEVDDDGQAAARAEGRSKQASPQSTDAEKAAKRRRFAQDLADKIAGLQHEAQVLQIIHENRDNISRLRDGDFAAFQIIYDAANQKCNNLPDWFNKGDQ